MFRRALLLGTVLLLALSLSGVAGRFAPAEAAEAVIGNVAAAQGEVLVMRESGARMVGVGDDVHEKDRIVTGTDGRVRVAMADGSTLSVGSDTEIVLSSFPDGNEPGFFDLVLGIVRTALSKRERDPGFEIRARTAVASVRSTDWIVEAKDNNTAVFVAEGKVAVHPTEGPGEVVLGPGDGTDVPPGGPPKSPVQWGQKRVDEFVARTSVGN
jgi:ferric-dicitrate binding protein FerR (iron transport regulator)